jgi:hypothetical protein
VSLHEETYVFLNTLEVVLLTMGDERQSMKFRQDLLCCVGFQHVYITVAFYNKPEYTWQSIKAQVMGAWENGNDTLNLQHLRQQILAMQRAYDQIILPTWQKLY